MFDHIWIIDLKQEFKGMKSIIRILPEVSVKTEEKGALEMLSYHNKSLKTKFDKNSNLILDRLISFEKDSRS